MLNRVYMATLMLLACSACQKSHTADEVSGSTDANLCGAYWQTPINRQFNYDAPTNALINAEVAKRNLDCHPDNQTCTGYGLKKGSKDYADCRIKLREMAEEKQQLDQLMQGLKDVKATPSTSDVTIHNRHYHQGWPYLY